MALPQTEKPICPKCNSNSSVVKKGKGITGYQKYRCKKCEKYLRSNTVKKIREVRGKKKAVFAPVPTAKNLAQKRQMETDAKVINYFIKSTDFSQKVMLSELGFSHKKYLEVMKRFGAKAIESYWPEYDGNTATFNLLFHLRKLDDEPIEAVVKVYLDEWTDCICNVETGKVSEESKKKSEFELWLKEKGLLKRLQLSLTKQSAIHSLHAYAGIYNWIVGHKNVKTKVRLKNTGSKK